MILTAASFAAIVEAGENVLTLIEGIDEEEFLRGRLTRAEVRRQLLAMAGAFTGLDLEAQARVPEIDWPGWESIGQALRGADAKSDDIAWFAARSLVPATLMWLQVYRKSEPGLFEFRP